MLYETKSLTDQKLFEQLSERLTRLGRKINNFIKVVEQDHNVTQVKESEAEYLNQSASDQDRKSVTNIQHHEQDRCNRWRNSWTEFSSSL